MTREQINELRALLAAGTPGDWSAYDNTCAGVVADGDMLVAETDSAADARLIVAMHSALGALLDAAERGLAYQAGEAAVTACCPWEGMLAKARVTGLPVRLRELDMAPKCEPCKVANLDRLDS
jgi:hypothetical protein